MRDLAETRERVYADPGGEQLDASHHTFGYLMNALFTPIDMTDYEGSYLGQYHTNKWPTSSGHQFNKQNSEFHPTAMDESWVGESEEPKWGLSMNQDERRSELPEEIEDEYPEDLDDEDDEGDDWNNGDENEDMYEDVDWPPKQDLGALPSQLDFFPNDDPKVAEGSNLRDRYNDQEIDSFMKLLDVKPFSHWQDESVYHHSMGSHNYEDESQYLDPQFHMLAEVERQHVERWETKEHRKGAIVRF